MVHPTSPASVIVKAEFRKKLQAEVRAEGLSIHIYNAKRYVSPMHVYVGVLAHSRFL